MNLDQTIHANGQHPAPAPLSERVRSLRLPEKANQAHPFPMVPWLLCFLLMIATGVLGYLAFMRPARTGGEDPVSLDSADKSGDPSRNTQMTASVGKDGKVLEAKGYIVAVHQVQVSPKVGGMVLQMNFVEGMWVPKDFVLAQIETIEFQSDFDRAEASADGARRRYEEMVANMPLDIKKCSAELDEAIARRDQARRDHERIQKLVRTAATSPQDVDQALMTYLTNEAKVAQSEVALALLKKPRDIKIAAAHADWQLAEAEKRKAKWKLDDTVVKAPIAGVILSKKTEQGSMVSPNFANNNLAASFCDMADLSDLEIDLAIAERDIHRVFKGQKCKLFAEAFPDRPYDGYVSRIMPIADRGRTSVPVRVKILIDKTEQGKFLRPDMGAVASFFKEMSTQIPKDDPIYTAPDVTAPEFRQSTSEAQRKIQAAKAAQP